MASKVKPKGVNRNIIIAVLAALLLVCGVTWAVYSLRSNGTNSANTKTTDAQKFASQYTKVGADNRFVYATDDEVLKVLESGTGIVFLGFPECPWCQQLAPIVNEAATLENLNMIYYLNIRAARADNSEVYQRIVEKLKGHLRTDENGNPRIYVPDVTALRDGEIVGRFEQEKAEGEVTPDTFWTDERRDRAVGQLRQIIGQTREFAAVQKAVKAGGLLLDVRTTAEFAEGSFDGATNLDVEDIKRGELPSVDKGTEIYVYCRSGNRSAQAVRLLKEAGFTKVKDLGGLEEVRLMGGALR